MFCVFFWLLLRWAKEDTERQDLLDFARDRGLELDDERARRAAAAGRAPELRRRLIAQAATADATPSGAA